jgi:hypothetical protein
MVSFTFGIHCLPDPGRWTVPDSSVKAASEPSGKHPGSRLRIMVVLFSYMTTTNTC